MGKKWEQILNKCSLDLLLLIIEKTKAEKEKVTIEIKTLEEELMGKVNQETFY